MLISHILLFGLWKLFPGGNFPGNWKKLDLFQEESDVLVSVGYWFLCCFLFLFVCLLNVYAVLGQLFHIRNSKASLEELNKSSGPGHDSLARASFSF